MKKSPTGAFFSLSLGIKISRIMLLLSRNGLMVALCVVSADYFYPRRVKDGHFLYIKVNNFLHLPLVILPFLHLHVFEELPLLLQSRCVLRHTSQDG